MSITIKLFHEFAKTRKPRFSGTYNKRVSFCKGTQCNFCPIADKTMKATCTISEEEFKELRKTHPEYLV
jgi:predicted metal-binding transcription factor (methanogenesis marker protein 9)